MNWSFQVVFDLGFYCKQTIFILAQRKGWPYFEGLIKDRLVPAETDCESFHFFSSAYVSSALYVLVVEVNLSVESLAVFEKGWLFLVFDWVCLIWPIFYFISLISGKKFLYFRFIILLVLSFCKSLSVAYVGLSSHGTGKISVFCFVFSVPSGRYPSLLPLPD